METSTSSRSDFLLLGLILAGLGFLAGWNCAEEHCPATLSLTPVRSSVVSSVHTRTDSASLDLQMKIPPMHVAAHPNLLSDPLADSAGTSDTVHYSISCLDTILKLADSVARGDTLEVCHMMPQDLFSLSVRFAPRDTLAVVRYQVRDSLIERSDTMTIAEGSKMEWYETPREMIGALFVGFLLGTLRK